MGSFSIYHLGFLWMLISWIAGGLLTQYVAVQKGYGRLWFWWGLLFGPIGLLASVGLPDRSLQK